MLPKDPIILLSVVNTRLRDLYSDLQELCAAEDADAAEVVETLASAGYRYDADQNQFVQE